MRSDRPAVGGAAILLAALLAGAPGRAEVIDRVLAVVSGTLLTLSDVHAALVLGLVPAGSAADPIGPPLDRLIDRALMLHELDRFAPREPDSRALAARAAALRARLAAAGDPARAERIYGLDDERILAIARDELRLEAYLDQRFAAGPRPGDDEVAAAYRERYGGAAGAPPLEQVAEQLRRDLEAERRARLVADWVRGLRERADVTILHAPDRAAPARHPDLSSALAIGLPSSRRPGSQTGPLRDATPGARPAARLIPTASGGRPPSD